MDKKTREGGIKMTDVLTAQTCWMAACIVAIFFSVCFSFPISLVYDVMIIAVLFIGLETLDRKDKEKQKC